MSCNILVTNDDGIYAEGIQLLCHALSQPLKDGSSYKLAVVAPNHEQSAVGHAITMHRPLRVEKVRFLHNPDLQGFAINGTPSDCVKLAVEAILSEKPDLVISGINRGSNLGTDLLYSGTVSAAVEGIILGVPAVAVSLTEGDTDDFIFAARFIRSIIPQLLINTLPAGTLLNINVPPGGIAGGVEGVRATRLGKRRYRNTFEERTDPRGRRYYWLAGELVEEEEEADTDVRAIMEGFISITPVHFDLTNDGYLPLVEKMIEASPGKGKSFGEAAPGWLG